MDAFPATATWRHLGAREGFEALFPVRAVGGWRLEGWTAAVEDGRAWGVRYAIALDDQGRTREARVECRHAGGSHEVAVEGDGRGAWLVNGAPAPHLEGCLDVNLEASAFTNAFPVRRLALGVGDRAEAPAAWVRAPASPSSGSSRPTPASTTRAAGRATTTRPPASASPPCSPSTATGW